MIGATRSTQRRVRFAVPVLALLVAAALQWARLDSTDQHVDEGWWITSGKLSWDLLFRHHRPDHLVWTDGMRTWGSPNPQLGKYLIGASVNRFAELPPVPLVASDGRQELAAGEVVVAAARQMGYQPDYDFLRSLEENRAAGRVPPPAILAAARRGVLVLALVAGALFWYLARTLAGEPAATVALLLWLANPALADHSARAMTDLPALTGVLLGLIGSVAVARLGRLTRAGGVALVLSALGFALGVATKLNVLAPLAGALLVAVGWSVHDALLPPPLRGERRRPIAWLWALALVVLPVVLTFATNPMLWTRPWTPIGGEPDRLSLLLSLGDTIETYIVPERLATPSERLAATARFLWIGRSATIGHRIGLPIEALLASLALAAGARRLLTGGTNGAAARAALAFATISTVTWAVTVAWLPFDWERFYLPLLPAYLLAVASGAVLAAGRLASAARPLLASQRQRIAP